MGKLEEGQKGLEERLGEKIDNLHNVVINFIGRTETLEKENSVGASQTRKLDVRVSDHDLPAIALLRQLQAGKRISKLKSPAQAA